MKTLDNEVQYESTDDATIHGVTATRAMWSAVGVELYANSNNISSGTAYSVAHGLAEGLMIAQDSLGAGADGPSILRRYAAQRRAAADHASLCAALRSINVSVPSNINVWQHLKGETKLENAAKSMAEAVKQLVDAAGK